MVDDNTKDLYENKSNKDEIQETLMYETELSGDTRISPDRNNQSDCEDQSNRKRPRSLASSPTNQTADENGLQEKESIQVALEHEPTESHLNEGNDNQEKKAFWRTLSFWQRASLDADQTVREIASNKYTGIENSKKSPKQDVDIFETQPLDSDNLFKATIANTPTTTITQHIVQSTVSKDEEMDMLKKQQTTVAQEVTNFTHDDSISDQTGSLWSITRKISYLQFLQPRVGESAETFVPNKLSQVIDTDQRPVIESNTSNSALSETIQLQSAERGFWWLPWKWDFLKKEVGNVEDSTDDIGSGVVEDELLKLQRKELVNQIKLLSYGIPKSATWGAHYRYDEDHCNVHITGSYRKPVVMKHLPQSAFEVFEKSLQKKKEPEAVEMDIVEPIVLPDIRWNYRNLTWRTRFRITLSKIPNLDTIFLPQKHLYLEPNVANIRKEKLKAHKKVVLISFHGFLPQKIVRYIIGEPSGNAEQMSHFAVEELKRWADINNIELDIDIINMEGHGKIFERVNGCLSFLDNFMNIIKSCDFLFCVANSHNVPVAIHTVAKLVTSGYLDQVEKLGLLSMSGLCLGPVPELESRISTRGSVGNDNDMISELFDLEDPDLLQGKELTRSMKILIQKNFKLTFVGALKDCFCPLYSSLALNFNHPNIYRAIYVDKESPQPAFIISLYNLILSIKNLNYRDHGLLIELSNFFIGAVGEGGHFRLLQNKYCYRVGINNMLNTCDLFYEQELKEELTNAKEFIANSYHIPWCLRGLLDELEKLKSHFDTKQIVEQLYQEFKSWSPDDSKGKELRYCMGAFENVLNEGLGI